MKIKFLPAVLVCLFLTAAAFSQNIFRLDERGVKAFVDADKLLIQLPFEHSPAKPLKIKLEILGIDDAVLTGTETIENLKRGASVIKTSVPFEKARVESPDLLWYRLRYTISPAGDADFAAFSGVLSLSEIMPDIFEIRAVGSSAIFAGINYPVTVRAFQPISNGPSASVKITGEIKLDRGGDAESDAPLIVTTQTTTGGDGYAVLNFKIPEGAKIDNDDEVNLKGEKGGLVRFADQDLENLNVGDRVYLNTDKPIYQPGQDFHVRGVYFAQKGAPDSRLAQSGREIGFSIEDEDETTIYRQTVTTSRFGIASIDWKIPENAKLGTYRVKVKSGDEDEAGGIYFKVSRYDLPNFKVNAKPDKNYYLPGQNTAEITVSADYLFGKPVARGAVKVVRETDRNWNYKEQKWEIEEAEKFEGALDSDGKFVAEFDLTKTRADLNEDEDERFKDLNFTAYLTDLSTNRTEQKRFDVRVTKEAVHVYTVGLYSSDKNPKLPIKFYVSTFYADGAPAECSLEIKGKYENENQTKTLFKTKTNRFGAGEVEFAAPKPEDDDYIEDLQFKVFAADAQNQTGTKEDKITFEEDEKQLVLDASKTIYKNGEPIDLKIVTGEAEQDVYVDVVKNLSVIDSRLVKIKNGRAVVKIPFRPEFKGELTVAAYFNDGKDNAVKDVRGVIYPAPDGLSLNAAAEKTTYRPGEEATVNFDIAAFDKARAESALGVVVFDKAIDERAAAEASFGGYYRSNNAFGDFAYANSDSKSFGALTVSRLNRLDQKAKVPADLQLAAKLLLAGENYYPNFFESDEYGRSQFKIFDNYFKRQFIPIRDVLANLYKADFTHPTDENSLKLLLTQNNVDFAALRDPWQTPYRVSVETERDEDALYIRSNGADKIAETGDDFAVLEMKFKYFTPTGRIFDRVTTEYHEKTGAFVRDYQTLRGEMLKNGIDIDALKDRFGNIYRYEFGVEKGFYTVEIKSDGKNGKPDERYGDDFVVYTSRADYFAETQAKIENILADYSKSRQKFPADEKKFKQILQTGGVNFDALRDGYGRDLYLEFSIVTRYTDTIKIEVVSNYGEKGEEKTTITPVTQTVALVKMKSSGKDAVKLNYDDFELAAFSSILTEQSKDDAAPKTVKTETIFTGEKGAIFGTVTDPNDAIVPTAAATATNEATGETVSVQVDTDGNYLFANLSPGIYTISISASGFSVRIVKIIVSASRLLTANIQLGVSGKAVTVNVMAGAEVNTTSSSISSQQIQELPINGRRFQDFAVLNPAANKAVRNKAAEENSTPRLREYFPETLLWQPEIVTDANGKAQIKFKLGDNLTTWKVYAIATDLNGKVGLAEQEIQAFQPFFVDLEPPKILTVGDEIYLPTQVRNYTETAQKVDVSMAKSDWFSFLKPAETVETQKVEVAANETQNAVFGYRAEQTIKAGKQKVTALAGKESDAIEKTTEVHPNGREIVRTNSGILRDSTAFDVDFPADALPETRRATVKIYPNLYAHIVESVNGLLERPYGCGEQTISSTYPNLMILKILNKEPDSPLKIKARKFLQSGYEKLLGYQKADGGFAVWTKDESDIALTAYALRFLSDAENFIEVDGSVIENARKWLLSQQRTDGSWTKKYSWETVEDQRRTQMLTTYAARSLALTAKSGKEKSKELAKAFAYLKERNAEIDEPYALANFALALMDAGDWQSAAPLIEKLENLAISEADQTYWNLETNTPFYGWGTPGRIETTAVVAQALIKFKVQSSKFKVQDSKTEIRGSESKVENSKTDELISRATMFLLKNKDRYGVWYSTQATINVLDAILAVVSDETSAETAVNPTAEIYADGRKIKEIQLPAPNKLGYPLETGLPSGASKIEIKTGSRTAMMWQIVQKHYVSWQNALADGRDVNQSRQIRMDYKCDKFEAKVMDEITCSVEAERVGFKGYGMLLAEIGIPPGADVERETLENALENDWSISRYDVLPDKIIVYLWAKPGGVKFNFKFRPRYAINANTAASDVYDYYNEEAKATLAPLKFTIK